MGESLKRLKDHVFYCSCYIYVITSIIQTTNVSKFNFTTVANKPANNCTHCSRQFAAKHKIIQESVTARTMYTQHQH